MGKKDIVIYSHAGSTNHGCEALLRTVVAMCPTVPTVFSVHGDDAKYNVDKICNYKKMRYIKPMTFTHYFLKLYSVLFDKKKMCYVKYTYGKHYRELVKNPPKVAISIGGDAYCYGNNDFLIAQNEFFRKIGSTNILLGCSIESSVMEDEKSRKDLEKFDYIFAREPITYSLLQEKKIGKKIEMYPDSAFYLPLEEIELKWEKAGERYIGINLSPMVLQYANNSQMLIENYLKLIEYLVVDLKYKVLFIPHVVTEGGSDLDALRMLYDMLDKGIRKNIIMVDENKEYNCMQLKYIISKCEMLITARTHASIAAYSLAVPTLVLGYSVKAVGIAQELFGDDKRHVLSVQEIKTSDELITFTKVLLQRRAEIRETLEHKNKEYQKVSNRIFTVLETLIHED